jgi:hypothetical protein
MSMPRPPTAHRHSHSNARQFDLFCDPPDAAAQTPQWQALPAETRHTLTKLMVRLIFGHADGDLAREREEMRHESEKIRPHHLERKAILYVRQSSGHQVLHNRESIAFLLNDRSAPEAALRRK